MGQPFDVVGYVYNADTYCESCIVEMLGPLDEAAEKAGVDPEDESSYDSDNFPKVIFRDSEGLDVCGKCGELLDTSWGGEEVTRARGMLYEYVERYMNDEYRNAEFNDSLREHLGWCVVDNKDERVMKVYDAVREEEDDDGS